MADKPGNYWVRFFKRQVFCGSVFAEATTRQDGGQVPDAGLLDWWIAGLVDWWIGGLVDW